MVGLLVFINYLFLYIYLFITLFQILLSAVFTRIISALSANGSVFIRGAVVALPTQTTYKRRMAIRACAALAGLHILHFVPVPVAATLYNFVQNQQALSLYEKAILKWA